MTIPVGQVTGIGPKTAEYLQSKSVGTAEALIKFGTEELSQAPGFSEGRAVNVITAAKALVGDNKAKSGNKVKDKKNKKPKDKKKNKKGRKDKKKDGKKDKKSRNKKKDKGKNKKGKK